MTDRTISFPMPNGLDPRTAQRLAAFGRRRARLLWQRGVFAALATLFAALVVVAAVDAVFILDDPARIALSVAAYAAAGFELWRLYLRYRRRRPDLAVLARMMETTRPELREDLLSAVELAAPTSDAAPADSPLFRSQLQQDVARRIEPLDVAELLPFRLIARWARLRAAAAALLALLLVLPGAHGARRLARAAWPIAPIDRVSRTRLIVRSPSPPDAVVPKGDAVPIQVEVAGRPAAEVFLDVAVDGRRARSRMKPVGAGKFAASIDAVADRIAYRARGGDAVTRWHELTAMPPPQVTAFEKTYEPPAYLARPPEVVRETAGDLRGVENTAVRLRLETDQPVERGELRVALDDQPRTIPLAREADGRWRADLRLEKSGVYEVHLVAACTGFENRFRPVYEIHVEPDLAPQVELVEPAADMAVPADEVVRFAAEARDDLGLARLSRMIQVQRSPWREDGEPIGCTGLVWKADAALDLLPLNLKAGDHVLVKYMAEDLKGARGESMVRRLSIVAEGFEPERRAAVEARRKLADALDRVGKAAREARQAVDASRAAARDETARRTGWVAAATAIQAAQRAAEAAETDLRRALEAAPRGAAALDMATVGEELSRLRRMGLDAAQRMASYAADAPPGAGRAAAEESAQKRLERAAQSAEQAHRAASTMVAADEAELAVRDLADIRRELERAADAAGASDPARAARLQAMAAAHMEQVAEQLADAAQRRQRGEIRDVISRLNTAAAAARKQLAAGGDTPSPVPDPNFASPVRDALRHMLAVADDWRRTANEDRQRLRTGRPNRTEFDELARSVEAAARADPGEESRREFARAHMTALRDGLAAVLRDRADLEERRRDADPQFVRDLTDAAAALRRWTPPVDRSENAAAAAGPIRELAAATRRLETGHELGAAARALAALAAEERWGDAADRQARQRGREWRDTLGNLPDVERALREQGFPSEVAENLGQARTAEPAQRANREMERRRKELAGEANVADEIRATADRVARAVDSARPAVDAARQWLAAQSPSLAEALAAARDAAAEARGQTEQAARDDGRSEADARREIRAALSRQIEVGAEVDEIRRMLRADAAAQDAASPEGRARARDADDALAMLREPPPRAEDLLRAAAAAAEPAPRRAALEQAGAQQQRLESALATLADHYNRLANGDAEGRRADLRALEEEEGWKAALDREYEQAAAMARTDAPPSLAELESQLAASPAMQAALDRLSRAELSRAAETVGRAAAEERAMSDRVAEAASRAASEPAEAGRRAEELARAIRQLADDTVRPAAREAAAPAPNAAPALDAAGSELDAAAGLVPRNPAANPATAANALEQSAAALRRASQQAGEAHRAAGEAASRAQNAGAAGAQAAAGSVAERAQTAAQSAQQLAAAASEIAAGLRRTVEQEQQALAGGAQRQPGLVGDTDQAGADVERAGRHQQRLNRNIGGEIAAAGARTRSTAAGEMTQAGDELARQSRAAPAAPALAAAATGVTQRAEELAALSAALPPPIAAPSADADSRAAAEWMARALDRLDAAQPAAAAPSPAAAQAASHEAMAQAAQAHAASMARARVQGRVPGAEPRSGAPVHVVGQPGPDSIDPVVVVPDDWARLPPQMARELKETQRENVPEEYRTMVELYFKAIAREANHARP